MFVHARVGLSGINCSVVIHRVYLAMMVVVLLKKNQTREKKCYTANVALQVLRVLFYFAIFQCTNRLELLVSCIDIADSSNLKACTLMEVLLICLPHNIKFSFAISLFYFLD